MNRLLRYIRQHLSLRLGLGITLLIAVAFTIIFGSLFYRSRYFVQKAAIDHAMQLLDNTAERISGIMNETELVGTFLALTTPQHLHPDSLLAFSRRAVADHPFLTGMAISMEPYFFAEMGRYYSAYSLRLGDSIVTVREGPFEYFEAPWYKTPRTLGTACWVDAFDDYNEGTLSSPDILTSFCCPMRDGNGTYLGSVTASLTLKWLSEAVTDVQPYPNSSAIIVGRDGTYLAHPDTTKLFRQTIFSDAAPEARADIERIGKAMIAGRSGLEETTVDGRRSFIFYRPLEHTGWSIALVCPQSDVFARYNRQVGLLWMIIGAGLLLLLLFSYQTVRHAIAPLKLLDQQARHIAEGRFDEALPPSYRHDSVGRLQHSFTQMQQALAANITSLRKVNAQLEHRNEELTRAYQLKVEANRSKAAFISDMYHKIRTPLNIVSGFAQVLTASFHELPADEVADITSRMKEGADDISRLARQLDKAAGNYVTEKEPD
ncbi:MAG: HAMP domain-containing protein [Prevotella sp.]|nr:HAMP domain-containing protein [Prevotella sp.]